MSPDFKVYSGALHLRTDRTMGPPVEEILKAAKACGVDYLIFTDIRDAAEARALRGWHGDVLVIIAEEVDCDDGAFLACDTRGIIGDIPLVEAALGRTREERGAVLGIQYEYMNGSDRRCLPPPVPLGNTDLFALWSFFDDYLMNISGRQAMQFLTRPDRILNGPSRRLVRQWDEQLRVRDLPAVGTTNALWRKDPLLDWRELFPYDISLNTIRTAIHCEELPEDLRIATGLVWKALKSGTSWIYNFAVGDARSIEFSHVTGEGAVTGPGGTTSVPERSSDAWIQVRLPAPAELVLRRDGNPLFWGVAEELSFPAPGAGVYRLEARVDGRPWLFTNAIRVGALSSSADAPVIEEFT